MLNEVESVKQQPGEDFCRWFRDEYIDLYVWTNPSGTITGFQLCYDKPGKERAFTWFSGKGFFHHRIDSGDQHPTKNQSPVLVQDGLFQGDEVERRFAENSKSLDANLAAFVTQKLKEYQSPSKTSGLSPALGLLPKPAPTVPQAGPSENVRSARSGRWPPTLLWPAKALLALFLVFALTAAYAVFKVRWAQSQVEKFCGEVVIGEPVHGYEAKAKDFWLKVRHLPEMTEEDSRRHPTRLLVWEGFVFNRWFCEIGHAGGKVISKKIVELD